MRPLMLAAALMLAAVPAAAAPTLEVPSGRYAIDPTHTSVTFKISHFGLANYTARFAKVSGDATVDAANPAKSSISVKIDANSVRTDYPFPEKEDFDKKIGNSEGFLNGAKFPDITFVSKSIDITGPKTAKITGDLTLRGITRPVVLDTVLNGQLNPHPFLKMPAFGISATTKINRSDFGLKFPPVLGEEVTILIESELGQAAK